MLDRNAHEDLKPGLSSLDPAEREALGEALLQESAAKDPAFIAQRLRHVVEQLATESVFAGMSEAEVRAILREAVEDLGVTPQQGAN